MPLWRKVCDAPEYEVSDAGDIRKNGHLMRPRFDKDGYRVAAFHLGGSRRYRYVRLARLILAESHQRIAKWFGVSASNVDFIAKGKTWKHLEITSLSF